MDEEPECGDGRVDEAGDPGEGAEELLHLAIRGAGCWSQSESRMPIGGVSTLDFRQHGIDAGSWRFMQRGEADGFELFLYSTQQFAATRPLQGLPDPLRK